jgi:D-beta-D-heptose 7-phosphate kinase/D-beta-D-heptose 1-phosphate adenosyltransferase
MSARLSHLVDAFAGLDVVVIGEAMLDRYLEGTTERLCREAPVPIVAVTSRREAPGGAANTALNARALGAKVHFLSVLGQDEDADLLRRSLERAGVDVQVLLQDPARRTLSKQRVVASSQVLVRFDQGSTSAIDVALERALIDRLWELVPRCDVVMVSDYGYGILTPRVIAALGDLQGRAERVVVVDAKDLAAYRRTGLTAVKPNYEEAAGLLALRDQPRQGRAEAIAAQSEKVLGITGARVAAVTLDTEGAVVLERGRPPYRTYAQPEHDSRATGAGDTFLAALGLALAAGAETPAAADLASAAAAVVVGKDGTATCSAEELRAHVSAEAKPVAHARELAGRLATYRRQGRRIVLTNGCFDILHRGHVSYLSRAKALGDVLIVGVNSDDSIRRLKGPTRPINGLHDRVEVLAALSCVDHVVPFDEDTPCELVRAVRPDVFVKGGDYTLDRLPEAAVVEELGGVARILPFVADRSTTDIIDRIRTAYGFAAPPEMGCAVAVANGRGGH